MVQVGYLLWITLIMQTTFEYDYNGLINVSLTRVNGPQQESQVLCSTWKGHANLLPMKATIYFVKSIISLSHLDIL